MSILEKDLTRGDGVSDSNLGSLVNLSSRVNAAWKFLASSVVPATNALASTYSGALVDLASLRSPLARIDEFVDSHMPQVVGVDLIDTVESLMRDAAASARKDLADLFIFWPYAMFMKAEHYIDSGIERVRDPIKKTAEISKYVLIDLSWVGANLVTLGMYPLYQHFFGNRNKGEGTSHEVSNLATPYQRNEDDVNGSPKPNSTQLPRQVYLQTDFALSVARSGATRVDRRIKKGVEVIGMIDTANGLITTTNQQFYHAMKKAVRELGYPIGISLTK